MEIGRTLHLSCAANRRGGCALLVIENQCRPLCTPSGMRQVYKIMVFWAWSRSGGLPMTLRPTHLAWHAGALPQVRGRSTPVRGARRRELLWRDVAGSAGAGIGPRSRRVDRNSPWPWRRRIGGQRSAMRRAYELVDRQDQRDRRGEPPGCGHPEKKPRQGGVVPVLDRRCNARLSRQLAFAHVILGEGWCRAGQGAEGPDRDCSAG